MADPAERHRHRHITSTLYDLMAAMHTTVEPHNDALVVAVVVHWLRTGRLTWLGDPDQTDMTLFDTLSPRV